MRELTTMKTKKNRPVTYCDHHLKKYWDRTEVSSSLLPVSSFDKFPQVCPFLTFVQRVEKESRQKKAPGAGVKMVNEEDPYGGSTDENTDAEAEEDHPIPELPGMPLFVLIATFCLSVFVPITGTHVLLCCWTLQTVTESNWMPVCLSAMPHKCQNVYQFSFVLCSFCPPL